MFLFLTFPNYGFCAGKPAPLSSKLAVIEGAAASAFLIGNSTVEKYPDGTQIVLYFFDHERVMQAYGNNECVIEPWKLTDGANCGEQSSFGAAKKCEPFHVRAGLTKRQPARGAVIGYYVDGAFDAASEDHRLKKYDQVLRSGNYTNCPSFAGAPRIPAVLQMANSASPQATNPKDEYPRPAPSSLTLLKRFLIGNSVVWPRLPGQHCGRIDYFDRSGRVFFFDCEESWGSTHDHPRLKLTVGSYRWKLVGNQFCFPVSDGYTGPYDDCDSILLRDAQPLPQGLEAKKQMIFMGGSPQGQLDPLGVGYIVQGNPAGFSPH
jgi:hypothetical protein